MAAAVGTDASVLAGAVVASSLVMCVVGLVAVPDAGLGITGATLVPLLLGVAAFLVVVLATVWWPGEQYFNAMRRRLQPLSADGLLDDLLTSSNGRLKLRTR